MAGPMTATAEGSYRKRRLKTPLALAPHQRSITVVHRRRVSMTGAGPPIGGMRTTGGASP